MREGSAIAIRPAGLHHSVAFQKNGKSGPESGFSYATEPVMISYGLMLAGLVPLALAIGVSFQVAPGPVEDDRAQYPPILAKAYFELGVAYIDYPFTARQLEPGFQAESIRIPHAAARLGLYGYRFSEHLAAQMTLMRPIEWVGYNNVNEVRGRRGVAPSAVEL